MCIYIYIYMYTHVYIYIYIWGFDYNSTDYNFKRNLTFSRRKRELVGSRTYITHNMYGFNKLM